MNNMHKNGFVTQTEMFYIIDGLELIQDKYREISKEISFPKQLRDMASRNEAEIAFLIKDLKDNDGKLRVNR